MSLLLSLSLAHANPIGSDGSGHEDGTATAYAYTPGNTGNPAVGEHRAYAYIDPALHADEDDIRDSLCAGTLSADITVDLRNSENGTCSVDYYFSGTRLYAVPVPAGSTPDDAVADAFWGSGLGIPLAPVVTNSMAAGDSGVVTTTHGAGSFCGSGDFVVAVMFYAEGQVSCPSSTTGADWSVINLELTDQVWSY